MTQAEILAYLGDLPDNDVNVSALTEQIRRGVGVVPFVGAGMSAPFRYPQWGTFLRDLAMRVDMVQHIEKRLAAAEYEEAAEDLIGKLHSRFQDLVEHHFGDHVLSGATLTGAIRLLPHLARGPVLTTNFDSVLERVFDDAGCAFTKVVWHDKVHAAVRAFHRNERVLLKIHGTWDDPEHRVLTHSEYRQYYGDPDGEIDVGRPLPELFRLLVTHPLLFLGCSLNHDRTVRIVAKIATKFYDLRHYAALELPATQAEWYKRAEELAVWNVRPIWYPHGHHEKIQGLLEYLAAQIPEGLRPRTAKKASLRESLPDAKGALIGRENELKELRDLITKNRLVTVAGSPGAGKTKLAMEVARSLRAVFDAVWFVPLPAHSFAVEQRIANTLKIAGQAQRSLRELIIATLQSGRHLLVLDNCEQVLPECGELVKVLLDACADLRIMATTRVVLSNAREHIYHIPPLDMPDADPLPDLQKLTSVDSVKLLLARAQARWNFNVTAENASEVAELCRRLEGIPLAIELAAAQLRVMSVEQILTRFNQRLDLWKEGRVAEDEARWATLRESIQFSFDLLGKDAISGAKRQALFRRLSVFHRGCTWEAATAVCGDGGQSEGEVLDLLKALLDASLLEMEEAAGERRFRYLESIREFAARELEQAGEVEIYAERHAQWCMELAEQGSPGLLKDKQALWLARLTAEADNLRAAILWAVGRRDAERALRLTGSLWRLMEIKGFYREGCARLRMVLAMPESARFPQLRSKALSGLSVLAYRQGDLATAQQAAQESLDIERRFCNQSGIANALNDLGNVAQMRGDFEVAHQLYSESLKIERATGNKRGVAVALFNTGVQARRLGMLDEARALLEESVESFESEGNRREAAFPMNALGMLSRMQGRYEAALRFGERSWTIRKELDDKRGIAESLRTVAAARMERGELAAAHELLHQSAELAMLIADTRSIAETVEQFAALATREKSYAQATSLYAAAEQIRNKSHAPLGPADQREREQNQAHAREALTVKEYDEAREAGRWMTAEQALAMAELRQVPAAWKNRHRPPHRVRSRSAKSELPEESLGLGTSPPRVPARRLAVPARVRAG
jgi:predicted ATPase